MRKRKKERNDKEKQNKAESVFMYRKSPTDVAVKRN